MKAVHANMINALILIGAGLYGYFGIKGADGNHSLTALIPTAFGLIFLLMHNGLAKSNKTVAHLVVLLTLVLLIMCLIRFLKIEEWDAIKYIFLICIVSNAVAFIVFIKSFIDARKERLSKQKD
ncbi:MAG: hypothetical protein ABIP80_05120 [Ferruginibacter sp.]